MGRITDALSKLKLNTNVTDKPFNKMSPKDMISLFYHLAEVYDAEALMPGTTVKKKLQVFKNFARVHSLIHLLPSVKEMKNQKKCVRLVNNLLDMLEQKYESELYTRKSWPVACKELPKIETAFHAGQYNIENLNLNPDAVPPGTSEDNKMNEFPGEEATHLRTNQEKVADTIVCVKAEESGGVAPNDIAKAESGGAAPKDIAKAPSDSGIAFPDDSTSTRPAGFPDSAHEHINVSKLEAPRSILQSKDITPSSSSLKFKSNDSSSEMNSSLVTERNEIKFSEQSSHASATTKRQFEPSVPYSDSTKIQKKSKKEHVACEQFIEAIENLSKIRSIVEIIGWSKGIFSHKRVWLSIQELIFTRILLGKELRKYKAKKAEGVAGTKVVIENTLSKEDTKTLQVRLTKVMEQVKKAVPDQLSEDLKHAVNGSCENVKLVVRDYNEW